MADRTCEVCGEQTPLGVQFCTSCGAYLGWAEPGVQAGSPPTARVARETTRNVAPTTAEPALAATRTAQPTLAEHAPDDVTEIGASLRNAAVRAGERCSRCGTANDASRRFCAKCGLFVGPPSTTNPPGAAPAGRPSWQRWLHGRVGSDRSARAAYRKSLPMLVRMRRAIVALVVLASTFGYLHFVGRDPLTWARHRLDTLRGTLVAVNGVTAAPDPPSAVLRDFPAAGAVDQFANTAWATNFAGPERPSTTTCVASANQGALLLTAPGRITLRAVRVRGGLGAGDQDRPLQWRPKALDLGFSDGTCQRVALQDAPGEQVLTVHTVRTNVVRVTIVAGYPPPPGNGLPLAAVADIALMTRPS